ncbi:tyrosine-protein phosphatase [Actinophytocola sediminis]
MAWIQLDNAVNVRDLGGLPTDGPCPIRFGRLIRSDNLQDLSPADITRLVDDVGVTTVIDLRSVHEHTAEGPGPLSRVNTVRHVHLSVVPESDGMTDVAADALAVRRQRDTAQPPADPLLAFYLGYLDNRPDSIVEALRSIAGAPGAALVHCAAGKDRTGVLIALALTVAGVPRAEVIADYLATGERIEAILARLRASPTYAEDIDRLPADEHRPRAAAMTDLLARLDEDHGGVLGWLAEHGFHAQDVQRLRDKLLEV